MLFPHASPCFTGSVQSPAHLVQDAMSPLSSLSHATVLGLSCEQSDLVCVCSHVCVTVPTEARKQHVTTQSSKHLRAT